MKWNGCDSAYSDQGRDHSIVFFPCLSPLWIGLCWRRRLCCCRCWSQSFFFFVCFSESSLIFFKLSVRSLHQAFCKRIFARFPQTPSFYTSFREFCKWLRGGGGGSSVLVTPRAPSQVPSAFTPALVYEVSLLNWPRFVFFFPLCLFKKNLLRCWSSVFSFRDTYMFIFLFLLVFEKCRPGVVRRLLFLCLFYCMVCDLVLATSVSVLLGNWVFWVLSTLLSL